MVQPQGDNLTVHANRVNLARRWSVQNEPDMVMESYCGDDEGMSILSNPTMQYTRSDCASIASHLVHFSQLPAQCLKYQDVASDLKRRDSDTTHGSSVLS